MWRVSAFRPWCIHDSRSPSHIFPSVSSCTIHCLCRCAPCVSSHGSPQQRTPVIALARSQIGGVVRQHNHPWRNSAHTRTHTRVSLMCHFRHSPPPCARGARLVPVVDMAWQVVHELPQTRRLYCATLFELRIAEAGVYRALQGHSCGTCRSFASPLPSP